MKRADPRGKIYYWMDGAKLPLEETDTDGTALHEGCVSVTPIRLDFTHHDFLCELRLWPLEWGVEVKV